MRDAPDLFPISGIPGWLPDEILFSLASRYHFLSGNVKAASTCNQLFGAPNSGGQHDFPCRLDEFVRRTNGSLGSAIEIIRRRTILPFYLPFRSAPDEAEAVAAMRGDSLGSIKYCLGILTSRFRANHPLKACLECMNLDTEEHATPFWHLSHQYPGVWVCPFHGVPLFQSVVKSTGVGRFQWYLPSPMLMAKAIVLDSDSGKGVVRKRLAESVAAIVLQYTRLPQGFRFDIPGLLKIYSDALTERGLISIGGRFRWKQIGSSFLASVEPLRSIPEFGALPSDLQQAVAQLGRLLRTPRSGTHPLRHLLLIQWLFGDWPSFIQAYSKAAASSQDDVAPTISSSCEQEAPPVDKRIGDLVSLLKDAKVSITEAARALGIDTNTAMVWAAREGISTPRRPKALKESLRRGLITDLRSGIDKAAAAQKYSVSVQTITRTLHTEVGLHHLWATARQESAREKARSEWKQIVASNANLGIKVMRMMAPSVYAWLYRNDRPWLREITATVPIIKKSNNSSIDWTKRDLELSAAIHQAALKLKQEAPEKKVFLWQLYQQLPELKAKLSAIERLPLTRHAIEVVTRSHKKIGGTNDLF